LRPLSSADEGVRIRRTGCCAFVPWTDLPTHDC
jgi:hypothetical protein